MHIYTWSDGGCNPNPGVAQAAAILKTLEGETISAHGYQLETMATNNEAEWAGLVLALEEAAKLDGVTHVTAHLDSQLIARQFTGKYSATGLLLEYRQRAVTIAKQFAAVEIVEIPREQNRAADAICHAVREGRFQAGEIAPGQPELIDVTFHVTVTMDPREARRLLESGTARRTIKADLAKRIAAKLPLCAAVGDRVDVTRISS